MVRLSSSPLLMSEFTSDDDFEAFMALIKFSIHATVAVTIPENGQSSSNPAVCVFTPRPRMFLTTRGRRGIV